MALEEMSFENGDGLTDDNDRQMDGRRMPASTIKIK